MKVGLIGTGNMGAGMAANLLKAGHTLTVYNRTREKAEPLAAQGAKVVDTPAEASGGDAVFTMLSKDEAVEEVVFGERGVLKGLRKGALHISSSTISVDLSRRLAAAHAEAGQRYAACPVLGRPDAAAAAKLFIIAAGPDDTLKSAEPLLSAVGQRTFVVSDRPEAANLVKLSANFLIANVIESLGEATALITKGGVDKHAYIDLLTATLFNAPVYKTYGGLIANEQFEPAGFAAPLGLKDMRLALAAGEELRVPLPIVSLLRDRYLALLAQGGDALDWSAIGMLAARDAGEKDAGEA